MTISLVTLSTPHNSNLSETSGDETHQTASSTPTFSSLLKADDKTDNNQLQTSDPEKKDSSDEQKEDKDNIPGKVNNINGVVSPSNSFDISFNSDNKSFSEDVYGLTYNTLSSKNSDNTNNYITLHEGDSNKCSSSIEKDNNIYNKDNDRKATYNYNDINISFYNNSDEYKTGGDEINPGNGSQNYNDYVDNLKNINSSLSISGVKTIDKESGTESAFSLSSGKPETVPKGSETILPQVINNMSDQSHNYGLAPDSGQINLQNNLHAGTIGKNTQLIQTEPFVAAAFKNIQSVHVDDIGKNPSNATLASGPDGHASSLVSEKDLPEKINSLPMSLDMTIKVDDKIPAYDYVKKPKNNSDFSTPFNSNGADGTGKGVILSSTVNNIDNQDSSSGNDSAFKQSFEQKNQQNTQHVDQDGHQIHAEGFSSVTSGNIQSTVSVEDTGQSHSHITPELTHHNSDAFISGDNNIPGKIGHLPSNLNVTVTTADKVPVHIQITKVEDNLAALSFQGTDEATTEVLKQTRHDLINHLDMAGISSTGVKITVLPPDTSNMSGDNRGGGLNNGSGFSGFSGQQNQQNSSNRGQNSQTINSIEPSSTSVHNGIQVIKTGNAEQKNLHASADLIHRGINISA